MAVAGTTVLGGRYTLLAVLGTGGMATVWRARDEMLSRDVAVKVLNPQHAADAEFLDRFEGEARHAAAVSHPRLVTVFDCGVESGMPFIVMELVVLFEMLTGRPPFTADSAVGLAYRQVHDDPGPPSAWRPGLPARLDQVTARLLAKDPSSRPPAAAAARADLLAVFSPADGAPNGGTALLPVTPGTAPGTPRQGWPPRPSEAALGAALAASLIALVVVLVTGGPGGGHPVTASGSPPASLPARPAATGPGSPAAQPGTTLSPVAAAAATLVGELKEGVTDGQVQQQYSQLVQIYTQDKSQGQVTGQAATSLSSAISALGAALGTL